MKKIVILSLGLVLTIAGLNLPLSEASRYVYHRFQSQPENFQDYRRFSEGIPIQKRLRRLNRSRRSDLVDQNNGALRVHNFRGSRQNFLSANRRRSNSSLLQRSSTGSIAPRFHRGGRAVPQPAARITPRVVEAVQSQLYTFENDKFSLQLPIGWELLDATNNIHAYTNPNSSYALRIKEFDQRTCGDAISFTTCARQLSRAENALAVEGTGRVETLSTVVRYSRTENVVLNQIGVQSPTYTEQFVGLFPFEGELTVSRYFVAIPDGRVFLIEATSDFDRSVDYTEITKRVFDSFRIYASDFGL